MFINYLKELKINGKSKNTQIYYESILKEANRYKPLDKWDKEDVTNFILSLQDKYKKGTIEAKKAVIKKFFGWAGKPEIVQHLTVKFPKTSLKRDDILTIEDINCMIEGTNSPMYKAMIAFLFESGGRINEVLPVLVDDIKETDKGMIIRIHATKTGDEYRSILCVFSAQYIRNHITYSGLTKGNLLFPVKRPIVHVTLNKIAKKIGLEKPISPHKFRHAQAVDMLQRGYQDQVTKKKLGWKDDSKMLARYSHIVDDDVINATIEKTGKEIIRQPIANIKQVESFKIADASLQLSKLNAEMEELRAFKKMVEEEFKRNAKAALQGK